METQPVAPRGVFGFLRARIAWLAIGVAVGICSVLAFQREFRSRESTPALRGERVAHDYGCFVCHGPEGRGGVADPGSRNGFVPGWDGPTVATLATDENEVIEWIQDGVPRRLKAVHEVAQRSPLIPMPAYRGRISPAELSDLLTYFRAVSTFGEDMPEPAYEGWKVAERLGCFGCHGPSGAGGAPNPGSFKGHIPSWHGEEFAELVRDDAELNEWILDGHPKRLWENPAARHFLEGQVIAMPAYRAHLSEQEQSGLVAYVHWLRKRASTSGAQDDAHRIMGVIARKGAVRP